MNKDPINWTNIHAYNQGKYISSTFTKQKYNNQTSKSQIGSMIFN